MRRRETVPQELKEQIIQDLLRGMTIQEARLKYDLAHTTIWRFMDKYKRDVRHGLLSGPVETKIKLHLSYKAHKRLEFYADRKARTLEAVVGHIVESYFIQMGEDHGDEKK